MTKIKVLLKNSYLTVEKTWINAVEEPKIRTNVANQLKIVSEYKNNIFDEKFDLVELLKSTVEKEYKNEEKIIRFSAILSSIKETTSSFEIPEGAAKEFESTNKDKIESYIRYVEERNKDEEVKRFYVANGNIKF